MRLPVYMHTCCYMYTCIHVYFIQFDCKIFALSVDDLYDQLLVVSLLVNLLLVALLLVALTDGEVEFYLEVEPGQ